jgi:hypothetical protein
MLDSANYNTSIVSINKSVTILAVPGAVGSVVAAGGPAISIATASVNVALRNLVVVPLPGSGGTVGIAMTNGDSLLLEQCTVAGMPSSGVTVSGPREFRVVDSTIRDNGYIGLWVRDGAHGSVVRTTISGNADTAIWAWGALAGTVTNIDVADSTLEGSNYGITAASGNATGDVKAVVRDSRVLSNATYGVLSQSTAGGYVAVSVTNSVVAHNGQGVATLGSGKVWVSGNAVHFNNWGFTSDPAGMFESAGNNALRNNTSNKLGAIGLVVLE